MRSLSSGLMRLVTFLCGPALSAMFMDSVHLDPWLLMLHLQVAVRQWFVMIRTEQPLPRLYNIDPYDHHVQMLSTHKIMLYIYYILYKTSSDYIRLIFYGVLICLLKMVFVAYENSSHDPDLHSHI
jgi:hypothetical protein